MENSKILKNIIKNRRSIFPRDYTTEDIPQEVLEEILNSATFAPNHKRTKPWRFKTFQGSAKRELGEKLAEIYKQITPPEVFLEKKYLDISEKISKANVVLSISVNFSGMVPEWEEIAAVSMAVQNMYLTCSVNEVGCYWSSPGMMKHLDHYLGLAENQKCYGLFYMGKMY